MIADKLPELGPSVRMFYGFALLIVLTVAQLKGLFRIIMIKNNSTKHTKLGTLSLFPPYEVGGGKRSP